MKTIRFYRQLRELRQRDLAAATGLSAPRICRIEKGIFPPREQELKLIAKALSINEEILVRETTNE